MIFCQTFAEQISEFESDLQYPFELIIFKRNIFHQIKLLIYLSNHLISCKRYTLTLGQHDKTVYVQNAILGLIFNSRKICCHPWMNREYSLANFADRCTKLTWTAWTFRPSGIRGIAWGIYRITETQLIKRLWTICHILKAAQKDWWCLSCFYKTPMVV